MTTTTTTTHVPLSERFNVRILVFVGVLLAMTGIPFYIYIHEIMTGGVVHLSDGSVQVDLKAMSTFEMDQNKGTINDVPPQFRELDGKRVVMEGEMWQPRAANGSISNFQLVYSIQKCCFSGPPKVQHFINAGVVDGKKVEYYSGLVKVTGTLHVNVTQEGGKVSSVYRVDVESVEPS